MKIAAAY